jgi:hypothetical protein
MAAKMIGDKTIHQDHVIKPINFNEVNMRLNDPKNINSFRHGLGGYFIELFNLILLYVSPKGF